MKLFIVIAMMACSSSSAYTQGLYWLSTTDAGGNKNSEENFAVPKKFKMVRTGESNRSSVMIFRLDRDLLWMLSPEEKSYSEMTFDDIEKMAVKTAAKMETLKEQMKGMPEEQRKMMEKMMGGNDQPVEVKKTAEIKTIAGYKCAKFLVHRGNEEVMSLWVTEELKEFKPLMADWKNFSERMSAISAQFAKGMADVYKNINGFPMETTMWILEQTITTTVTKVEKRPISPAEFEIPPGYTKVKNQLEKEME